MKNAIAQRRPASGQQLLHVLYGRRVRSYLAARLGRDASHDLVLLLAVRVWAAVLRRQVPIAGFGDLAAVVTSVVTEHYVAGRREAALNRAGGAR
ncbi:hypothetical protein [Streptomyces carpaticus]|uniref:Uncharacterized protein n=1 Tax=Streptomyces carpaticus TaxID=285558 RepID=A0ABV4ZUR9_9ACTN